ncbi:sensor histidine kinase [Pedobacter cryophilus]|uniref:histidine kinase n=1 Tax=Pedobacter cryophilus TaxID=2571271 RepID=A0A4U1C449_9SPHI|nr:HAMP domain-containing sensor histidine kinase [Pedobacter cryophilus]TKC00129.1 HAMP domain-containing histidine kinase [Pedobacter cryophilus]
MNFIYYNLNKIRFLQKSYSLKFLFIAFLGIHIPLIGVIIFILNSPNQSFSKGTIISLTLILTLIAALATLAILKNLLAPLIISKKSLEDYLTKKQLPNLPLNYLDEAGILMSLIQKTVNSLDLHIKEKQEITTLVSHNLRTPLNQIKGLCELTKIDAANSTEYINQINSIANLQLQGLTELLDQLMHNNLEASTRVEAYEIGNLIDIELNNAQLQFKKKNLTLVYKKSNRSLLTTANEKKISLVFQNLISNAIKFSFNGGKIYVETKSKDQKLEILVRDEGMGFSENYKPNLFKDARNLGRLGTENEPSVGLGLHLSKRTVEQLGGLLVGHSDGENKGATFSIII